MRKFYEALLVAATTIYARRRSEDLLRKMACLYAKYEYEPRAIPKKALRESIPEEVSLEGVPKISRRVPLCFTTALEMAAKYYGVDVSIDYVNLASGWTYTWTYIKGLFAPLPLGDPRSAIARASPYLGLEIRLYVAEQAKEFFRGLRYFLSRGLPAIVEVDPIYFWSRRGIGIETTRSPFAVTHAELLVGYEDEKFLYYETGLLDVYEPRGGRGLEVYEEVLEEAVERVSRTFMLPWRYHFWIAPSTMGRRNIAQALIRAGRELVGFSLSGWVFFGSYVLEELAREAEDLAEEKEMMKEVFEMAAYYRKRNSRFLRTWFSDEHVVKAAELLESASDCYSEISNLLSANPDIDRLRELLSRACRLERGAGSLLARGAGAPID